MQLYATFVSKEINKMQLFYFPDIKEKEYTLTEEESKHSIRVLRLKIGDIIHITDGNGNMLQTELVDDHPKKCRVKIIDKKTEFGKKDFYLHLAVAPTKNNSRYEWFLEKATEIGIDEITPIICEHSERKEIKIVRMDKIIISAIKQSLKAYKPKFNESVKFSSFIKQTFIGKKFIAYCDGNPGLLKNLYNSGENALVMIGPEGDFSPEEVKMAVENGFEIVSLGKSRLRTETAAIAACHTINLLND